MDHFKGINETERFNNELMQHTRRQVELLEQIAQLLQPKVEMKLEEPKQSNQRRKQT